jgi:hypothetical protein
VAIHFPKAEQPDFGGVVVAWVASQTDCDYQQARNDGFHKKNKLGDIRKRTFHQPYYCFLPSGNK